MSAHTPTPRLIADGEQIVTESGLVVADFFGDTQDETEALVAFIVLAVNAHDKLVEALEAAQGAIVTLKLGIDERTMALLQGLPGIESEVAAAQALARGEQGGRDA